MVLGVIEGTRMFYVTKTYDHALGLSACFRQWRAESHCRFLHGYALSFKLTFAAHTLDHNNWVIDFGGLKPVKQFLCDTFDHKLAVAADDPMRALFEAMDAGVDSPYVGALDAQSHGRVADVIMLSFVGCEGFAQHVYGWVDGWLRANYLHSIDNRGLRIVSVEVREHGGNSAIFEGGI